MYILSKLLCDRRKETSGRETRVRWLSRPACPEQEFGKSCSRRNARYQQDLVNIHLCQHDQTSAEEEHTAGRRKALMRSKDFFCECCKCMGPDFASGQFCDQPGCFGVKFGYHRQTDGEALTDWRCIICGNAAHPDSSRTQSIEPVFNRMQLQSKMNAYDPLALKKLIEEALAFLPPTNHLILTMLRELGTWHFTLSSIYDRAGDRRRGSLSRHEAIKAAVWAIKSIECCAAGCTTRTECQQVHLPCSSALSEAFFLCMDLLDFGARATNWFNDCAEVF